MEFPQMEDLAKRLRARRQKSPIEFTEPSSLELEAATAIDSLLFQLKSRVERAPS